MKIILNILTHGDETIGLNVAREINKLKIIKGEVVINIANKLAYSKKKRFIDEDLNRVFPGNKKGNYEQKLAAKILPLIKSADVVIDIHSTKSNLRDALIVTKINKKTREYIKVIGPKYLLWMRVVKDNALMSDARVGIAFEYGKNNDKRVLHKIVRDMQRLLSYLGMISKKTKNHKSNTKWFDVYKSVPREKRAKLLPNIKNYKLIKSGSPYAVFKKDLIYAGEDFYPILFGEKSYKDIFGFAARTMKS